MRGHGIMQLLLIVRCWGVRVCQAARPCSFSRAVPCSAPVTSVSDCSSQIDSSATSATSTFFFLGLAMPTRFFALPKPCHWFVCLPLTQHAKSLHSAEESADAHRIVQRVGTYHEPRPQKSRAALALQRQERPNSRTELGPRSITFKLYHFTV